MVDSAEDEGKEEVAGLGALIVDCEVELASKVASEELSIMGISVADG
jgi:hypothetical protein